MPPGYEAIRAFYDHNRADLAEDEQFLRSTIERHEWVARFRNEAERRHLGRCVDLRPEWSVLDLGGGAGRYALHFARRCRRVAMVEFAPSLAEAARRRAARERLANLEVHVASVLDFDTPERFDLAFAGGLLMYLEDADLRRLADAIARWVRPGGRLVLREPVSPGGRRTWVHPDSPGHRGIFRHPDEYAALFASRFALRYRRQALSQMVPRFLAGSSGQLVERAEGSPLARLARRWLPLQARFDYWLVGLEERLRAGPLARLLADVDSAQYFYVFERVPDGA